MTAAELAARDAAERDELRLARLSTRAAALLRARRAHARTDTIERAWRADLAAYTREMTALGVAL